MAKKKPKKPRKIYRVIKYEYGKEIVFKDECQPISWAQLEKIIEKEFPNCPREKLLIMAKDDGSLGIGEDAPEGFWKNIEIAARGIRVGGPIGGQK